MNLIWSAGIATVNPLPSQAKLNRYYEKFHADLKEEFNFKREQKRLKHIQQFKTKGRLLDLGAGQGYFVAVVNQTPGWQATGQDISVKAAWLAKRKFNLNLLTGEINNLKLKNNYFDVITLHSVLEHLRDPDQVIVICFKKLKPGGLLVFSVPNLNSFEFYLSRFLYQSYPGYIFEHLHYFTPIGIRRLLKRHNFTELQLTSRHYSPIESLSWKPYRLLTNLAKRILEYTDLGGSLCFGNLIYVYAQKPD